VDARIDEKNLEEMRRRILVKMKRSLYRTQGRSCKKRFVMSEMEQEHQNTTYRKEEFF